MKKIYEIHNGFAWASFIQAAILFLFIFPLFFQLSGSIFTSTTFDFDSEGKLVLLPLPLASIFCFIGIAFLLRLEKIHYGMSTIFATFVLMMFSIIITSNGSDTDNLAKFILAGQFCLPMFALLLGNLYLNPKFDYLKLEAIILYILVLIIPLEVISTLMKGSGVLHPSVYVFSLYQHTLYLPVVFVGLFFISLSVLSENNNLRYFAFFLTPWMGVYLSASISVLATILAILCTIIVVKFFNKNKLNLVIVLLIFWVAFAAYTSNLITLSSEIKINKSEEVSLGLRKDFFSGRIVKELYYKDRLSFFLKNDNKVNFSHWTTSDKKSWVDTVKTILFGRVSRLDREVYPTNHNYYLDLIYHFGLISALPLFFLIFLTIKQTIRIKKVGQNLTILFSVVAFFIFVENIFNFSFRQPYPGMIIFFLWGVLLKKMFGLNVEVAKGQCKKYGN